MKFHYANLETCVDAKGTVIVIDVLRAFSTAAYIFSRGAKEIYPVSKVEEALDLKKLIHGLLACGEVAGIRPEGFDFGNSPTESLALDLNNCVVVQRTSAGTQGIVRSANAGNMLAASFVVAGATANYIRQHSPDEVTFVVTGASTRGIGEEDQACAEYLEELLKGNKPDPNPYLERVRNSKEAIGMFFESKEQIFPKSDLIHCTHLDAFDFAMPVFKENGRHVMRTIKPD